MDKRPKGEKQPILALLLGNHRCYGNQTTTHTTRLWANVDCQVSLKSINICRC